MLRKLINTYIIKNIKNKKDVALLFSGGMDSLSILLSCIELGIRPHLYTFALSNYESEDIIQSRKIAKIFDLDMTEIIIDVDECNLIDDIRFIINRFKVKKKTQIQCIHPFIYIIPQIQEDVILTGLCADDLYGTARSIAKYSKEKDVFNKIRLEKHKDVNASSFKQIKLLCEDHFKALLAPYKEDSNISEMMLKLSYIDLNSPKQKNIMYEAYKEELSKYKLYRKSSNLQCNSNIREWHDTLLQESSINRNGFKSVVGIYNLLYKEVCSAEHKCHYCGKILEEDEDCLMIGDCGEIYCYGDINYEDDIRNTCIGKELLRCGYSQEFILDLFYSDLEDREIDLFYTTCE